MIDIVKAVAISAVGVIAGVALGTVLVGNINKESEKDSSETEAQPEAE